MPNQLRKNVVENHRKIEASAAKLFAENGVAQVSVADVMNSAGMTHGGFYRYYESKIDLAAAACRFSFENAVDALATKAAAREVDEPALSAMAGFYLSPQHRDAPGLGCPVAAYATDAWREDGASPLRQAYLQGMKQILSEITAVSPGASLAQREEKALGVLATMVGALCISRAVNGDTMSEQILDAARTLIKAQA